MSCPQSRVSQDGTRLSDAPTCPDRSGRVYREPQSPQKLHSPYCTIRVSRCGTSRDSVSTPQSACVCINIGKLSPSRSTCFIVYVCIVFDRKHQRANEHRELSLLAYLSQLQSPEPGPVRPIHSLTPFQVHEKDNAAVVLLIGVPVFYYYLRK